MTTFDPDTSKAPRNVPLIVEVSDGRHAPYVIPYPFMRLDDGSWVNAELGTDIGDGLAVLRWRPYLAHGKTHSEQAGASA